MNRVGWGVLFLLTVVVFATIRSTHLHQSGQLSAPSPTEQVGTVAFPVSCAPSVRARFNRGVALLHDFWYDEARAQFEQIATLDPTCAMAHWGIAMSVFRQLWERPDDATLAMGWREMQAAESLSAPTALEQEYIDALGDFFRPGTRDYAARVERYAESMGTLYGRHPGEVDAGAFYALAILAAEAPDDTSLTRESQALAVLRPLYLRNPDHPGVVHYIIHACDTPSMASQGLAAAQRYGHLAASAPHAVHMPGHIFARLGMWQADIDANHAAVAASKAAEDRHQSGAMDQFHADDFLLYAYLQSGQDDAARAVVNESAAVIDRYAAMPAMNGRYMVSMFPYFRTKLPIILALETRDWNAASALQPIEGAPPEVRILTYWARTVADGHLHRSQQARSDGAAYVALMAQWRSGVHLYTARSTSARIQQGEMFAWTAFAQGDIDHSLTQMRETADLQDQVGQGEVDIPAREMLADMLLETAHPREALVEYRRALTLSPNRFNGLYNAGRAAEAVGDRQAAAGFYAALLDATTQGAHSSRLELQHAKIFMLASAGAHDR
jgi:tetratricopeptide (TPR) repeat protein